MKHCRFTFKIVPTLLIFVLVFVPFTFAKDLATAGPETVGLSSERLSRIDAHLNKTVEQQRVKGMVAMVARNGKIAYHSGSRYDAVGAGSFRAQRSTV